MMTTLCAIMGALPIALGFGSGAELPAARRGHCRGPGLLQLITLFIAPVLFLWFDALAGKPVRSMHLEPSVSETP